MEAILEYIHVHHLEGVYIAFEADFAPFQPDKQAAVKDDDMGATLQFSHKGDGVAGSDPVTGAVKMDTSKDKDGNHDLISFTIQDILSLPTGSYKIVNGKIVEQK